VDLIGVAAIELIISSELNAIGASSDLHWIFFAVALSARINQIVASSNHPSFSDCFEELAALWCRQQRARIAGQPCS
jgi:hypothetical protein